MENDEKTALKQKVNQKLLGARSKVFSFSLHSIIFFFLLVLFTHENIFA